VKARADSVAKVRADSAKADSAKRVVPQESGSKADAATKKPPFLW